jgi:flagellar motor switch protein FliG
MIDRALLAKALKNIDPQYQEKVFQNMTDDAAEAVKAMMNDLNDISVEATEAAQQEIMTLASQLM